MGLQLVQNYGKAHLRNRVKRLIRESYKNFELKIEKGYSFVFLVKKDINTLELDYNRVYTDMESIFSNAKLFNAEK